MSLALPAPAPVRPERVPADRWVHWTARLLLACLVSTLLWLSLAASRPATLADLETQLRAREVETLEVRGGLQSPDSQGYSPVDLRWRSGWTRHEATAVEASPGRMTREAVRSQRSWTGAPYPVVEPGLRERLAGLDPDVRIVEMVRQSGYGTFYGWKTPMVSFSVLLVFWLGTLVLVLLQPAAPQRATRVAWTWLVLLTGPLGALGYLVLGGPAGLLDPPAPGRRRLTGGWAFVLAVAATAVMSPDR
ncbi:hypothetical protein [Nocardioides sp. 616]|uniref:hypothetical protein n=1 Tax=Nocardioides sp. 616 TaxID=2268090 RepID=UPI000CE559DB|nr:hypothetical protein [Nocardioides sp. 616]